MSIRNQPCPQRDGGMEVDGDMEVGSIKIKTLSVKINTQPMRYHAPHNLFRVDLYFWETPTFYSLLLWNVYCIIYRGDTLSSVPLSI